MASPAVEVLQADTKRDLVALVTWLRTFSQFEACYDESIDETAILDDQKVAITILNVAEEICDRPATSTVFQDVNAVWGALFHLVTTEMSHVMRQIMGKRVSTVELRVVLLSALLCRAVSEQCGQRRTYIERIMGLSQHAQHVLMMLIEQGRTIPTTPQTPQQRRDKSSYICTTPRSSGSRRNLDQSFASTNSKDGTPVHKLPPTATPRSVKQSFTSPLRSVGQSSASRSKSVGRSVASPPRSVNRSFMSPPRSVSRSFASPRSVSRSFASPSPSVSRSFASPPRSVNRSFASPARSVNRSSTSPARSVSRSLASPPRSLSRSLASPSRPSPHVANSTPRSGSSEPDAERRRNLLALMAWVNTFPQMRGLGPMNDIQLLDDFKVLTAIVQVAEDICGETLNRAAFANADDAWNSILDLVSTVNPLAEQQITENRMSSWERQTSLLTALLCYSVAETCTERKTYIGRILGLPGETQHRLMKQIDQGRRSLDPSKKKLSTPKTNDSATPHSRVKRTPDPPERESENHGGSVRSRMTGSPSSDRSRSREEAFGSPSFSGYTPQRKKPSAGRVALDGFFSPATIDSALEKMVADLRKQNEALQHELETSQKREVDLGHEMHDVEAKLRKQMMKIESAALRREEEARDAHDREILLLRKELGDVREVRAMEEHARRELASVMDEMDMLEHTRERLAETEEKLRKCRDRLEQLGDVKDALKREEEAHSASVEECLRLENELKALQPLRRQLEDYKTRAVEAEVKLAECQEDMKRLAHISQHLNSAHKDLLKGARIHKEEADELRRRLLEDDESAKDLSGPAVGEGLSELNPAIKEEMARLRNENIQLKAFAAKREDDSVQQLEEQLDDFQRLSNKFKDQFFSTKGELELTQQELEQSKGSETKLQAYIGELNEDCSRLQSLNKDLEDELSKTKNELEVTEQQLHESRKREAALRVDVEEWTQRTRDAESVSQQRLEVIQQTKEELDAALNSLLASRAREEGLVDKVADWTEKAGKAEASGAHFKEQYETTKKALIETTTELAATQRRAAMLKDEVMDLTNQIHSLEVKLDEERKSKETSLLAADSALRATRVHLDEKSKKELEELERNMNLLLDNERAAYKKQLAKASDDYMKLEKKAEFEYAELKERSESELTASFQKAQRELAALDNKYLQEMSEIKRIASEEREVLLTKGKTILREAKQKATDELNKTENELRTAKLTLAKVRKEHADYEQRSRAMLASFKHKVHFASGRITELSRDNDELRDSLTTTEREKFKLQEENERFRRQLGGRFGADGKVQNQLEMLQKEFNAVLEENRELKKGMASLQNPHMGMLSSIPESAPMNGTSSYTRGGVSGSTLAQLRKEYEETIEALNDEKRELVMRNSAAITDVQKAEQKAWASDTEVAKLQAELTSVKLALQRAERFSDDHNGAGVLLSQDDSYLSTSKENATESKKASVQPLVDLNISPNQATSTSPSILSPSAKINTPSTQLITKTSKNPIVDAYDFRAIDVAAKPKIRQASADVRSVPSLMDYAKVVPEQSLDAQPECKQS